MTQDIRSPTRRFGKAAALLPLAFVATAVAILAVGAGRTSEPEKPATRVAAASAERAASREDIARDNARAEEAAAAAMMALALARVAPTVDEARLAEAERAAQARKVDAEADKARERKAVRREATPTAPKPVATTHVAPAPTVAESAPAPAAAPQKVAEKPGVFRRMGEYVPSLPSPGRIVDAMGNGVSRIADLMPKF